jgi:DNA-binding response OmpR family regulator
VPECRRIMVVEDDRLVQLAVAEHLRRVGYAVVACGSGEEALEQLAQREADAVVLDLDLPGIDGLTTLERARARWPGLKVVLCSARHLFERDEALRRGAVDFVPKPFCFRFLDAVLARVLAPAV